MLNQITSFPRKFVVWLGDRADHLCSAALRNGPLRVWDSGPTPCVKRLRCKKRLEITSSAGGKTLPLAEASACLSASQPSRAALGSAGAVGGGAGPSQGRLLEVRRTGERGATAPAQVPRWHRPRGPARRTPRLWAVAAARWPAERAPPGGAPRRRRRRWHLLDLDRCRGLRCVGGNRGGEGRAGETLLELRRRRRRRMSCRFTAGGNDVQTGSPYPGPASSLRQGWALTGLTACRVPSAPCLHRTLVHRISSFPRRNTEYRRIFTSIVVGRLQRRWTIQLRNSMVCPFVAIDLLY